MELIKFTATNFRSITSAQGLALANRTVLIGPNNEGKSNILLALVTAMRVMERGAYFDPRYSPAIAKRLIADPGQIYDWDRDFPKYLQNAQRSGHTTLRLEFELEAREVREFQRDVGSSLNGSLPVEIALGADTVGFKVRKQGPGATALTRKSAQIANFISKHIRVEHIAAVRTAAQAEAVVTRLVEDELRVVEKDPQYKAALRSIAALQQPILERLQTSIGATLKEFLPSIKGVTIVVPQEERLGALRRCSILVDDGTKTRLQHKGDGAQSLAALGMMRHQSNRDADGRSLVIAIEEPESHLHPDAIHRLREVIDELAARHQVVLTTHCPVFADRLNTGANIIVRNRSAAPAQSIDAVRRVLGVRAADNLRNAELVLLVEGESDRIALTALLKHVSPVLREALRSGGMGISALGGASKLSFHVRLQRDAICGVHCFLDNDQEAATALERAKAEGLLTPAEVTQAICPGLRESELEDLYVHEVFDNAAADFGVSGLASLMRGNKKWTDRLRDAFRRRGKPLDDVVKDAVKGRVAMAAAAAAPAALHPNRRSAIDGLVEELVARLRTLASWSR